MVALAKSTSPSKNGSKSKSTSKSGGDRTASSPRSAIGNQKPASTPPMATANRLPASPNGFVPPNLAPPLEAGQGPIFTADAIEMQHKMRINPLPMLNPQMLGIWLDQFEYGMLRQAVLLWEAMCKRDDTLITVKPQLENEVSSKQWGVFTVEGADEVEAARHKACLDYFYDHLRATDAYDRNVRGGRDKLLEQMMSADSFFYAVHHFVWQPQPGKMIPVEGANPVPVITAELEYVPLWFFENTTGRLRFLKDGGFGVIGENLENFGDWIITTGRGLMFAASICYTFKRHAFQDWTIFNERYAQNKVIGTTPAKKDDEAGRGMKSIVEDYNSDQGFVLYEYTGDPSKPPIGLIGPQGTAAVEIWDKFIERQDRKMSSMYRGNDLSMMSRAGKGEKPTGASLQQEEGEEMVRGACRRIAGTLQESVDRRVIELCFGPGVEPLAYFGLPDLDAVDTADLRMSAGFLADRGAKVSTSEIADRLGIELVTQTESSAPEDVLQALKMPGPTGDTRHATRQMTANADLNRQSGSDPDIENFLGPLTDRFKKAYADDLIPLRLALEHVLKATPGDRTANARALQAQLPWLADQILGTADSTGQHGSVPRAASALVPIIEKAMERGVDLSKGPKSTANAAHWVTVHGKHVLIHDGDKRSTDEILRDSITHDEIVAGDRVIHNRDIGGLGAHAESEGLVVRSTPKHLAVEIANRPEDQWLMGKSYTQKFKRENIVRVIRNGKTLAIRRDS